ncbi:MAG: hypothetical protein R3Y24_03360 [Eubacteriales bacterium]
MSNMSYHCPNCGSGLRFNPKKGSFDCSYCNSEFNRYDIERQSDYCGKDENNKSSDDRSQEQMNQGKVNQGEEVAVYLCNNCGAHILTSLTTVAAECYYCNHAIIMKKTISSELPSRIIPFKMDKETAKASFTKWISRDLFIPNGFKNGAFFKSMHGVYFPYWMVDVDGHISYQGKMMETTSQITKKSNVKLQLLYDIEKEGQIHMEDIMLSALKKSSNKLMEGVQPFDESTMEPFTMTYLSGFQAEQKDIEVAELNNPETMRVFHRYAELKVLDSLNKNAIHETKHFSFVPKKVNWEYTLMPVWVLTYEYKGELYHYAMNGQNGKACGRIPLDMKKLVKTMVIVGTAIFAFLAPMLYIIGGGFGW